MRKLYIYKTNKNNYYFESDDTYKETANKDVLYEIETDYSEAIKKTKLNKEVKTMEDVDALLKEIFCD